MRDSDYREMLARWPYKCRLCHQRFQDQLNDNLCEPCGQRVAAERAARREWMLRTSGISPRHAKYATFAELRGTPEYGRTRDVVARFIESGDGIMALIGRRGTGKTQLAAVAVRESIERGCRARILTANRLVADLKRRFAPEADADGDWLREWLAPGLLVVDEIAELTGGDHVRAAITELLNARYEQLNASILIGNLSPDQFQAAVGASIADRCNEGGGVVVCDGWPSFRTGRDSIVSDVNVNGSDADASTGGDRGLRAVSVAGLAPNGRYVPETRPTGR